MTVLIFIAGLASGVFLAFVIAHMNDEGMM